ncbi:hypothetical protein AGMMS50230_05990 [Spirochaetia bacterium]|nr:hypothetical protein AGMMS50230_05990 [Spirochaetia bacterium]
MAKKLDTGKDNTQKIAGELFHRVFTEISRTTWPLEYRKTYIKDLAKQNSLTSRQLSPAILNKTEEDIRTAVEAYDPNYKLFLSYYRIYESLGTKLIGLYHFKNLPDKDRHAILNTNNGRIYDFKPSTEWQVSACSIKGNGVNITLSKLALQPVNANLHRSDFPDDTTWNLIRDTASEVLHTGEELLEVRATITAEKRSIITLSIDLDNSVMEIGNDIFQADKEGNKLTHEENEKDRKSALRVAGEYLKLSSAGTQVLIDALADTSPVIGKKTEEKLHQIQDKDILIVRIMGKYHAENKDEIKLSEDAEISMPNQKLKEIIKSAEEFYNKMGTFEGFFIDYPWHKTDEGTYSQLMNSKADLFSVRAYALIIRPVKDFEKSTFEGSMKDKVIDYITYLIDIQRGEVEIKNGNYSEQAQRTFLDRIVQIDRQARAGRSSGRKIS